MWYRHKLKQEARHTLRQNYWRILLLCLLVSFLVGSMIILNNIDTQTDFRQVVQTGRLESKSNSQIVNDFLRGDAPPQPTKTNFTQGFFAIIINNIYGAGSFLFGTLNAFNQIFFQDRIGPGIIIFIGALIYLLYWLFVSCIVQVGQCRFFLETRIYYKTPINRLLFSYRFRYGLRTAWAMLVRQLYLFFWWLTLIGGIIKTYSYRLMPYILAENPSLSRREAMQLSQAMMQGQKWQTFLLDLSFLGWQLLDIFSFHLLSIFYLTPYKIATNTELYMNLRSLAKVQGIPNAEKLCDSNLNAPPTSATYPESAYFLPTPESRRWLQIDYRRQYSFSSLLFLFFLFSFIGWVWEVGLHLSMTGNLVNRGVLLGPWLPIYGVGGVLALLTLKKIRENHLLTFFAMVLLAGIIEYFTSWFLETTFGLKWWDYTGYFLNLNGRICLEGLLTFGLAGSLAIYFIAPLLDELLQKIPQQKKNILLSFLLAFFFADLIHSLFQPNTGLGITDYPASPAMKP